MPLSFSWPVEAPVTPTPIVPGAVAVPPPAELPTVEVVPRYDQKLTLTTTERGRVTVRLVDRINVDDVFLHLVSREIYRVATGTDPGAEVEPLFKEFLLKERFTTGQS